MIEKIGLQRLLEPNEIKRLQDLSHLGNESNKEQAQFEKLEQKYFEVFSDWRTLSIYTLISLKSDIKAIPDKSGIKLTVVRNILKKLQDLEMVSLDKNKVILTKSKWISLLEDDKKNLVAIKLQKQLIAKSLEAIENIKISKRDHTGITFLINDGDIDFVKEEVKKFRRCLLKKVKHRKKPNCVYQLSFNLFPMKEL